MESADWDRAYIDSSSVCLLDLLERHVDEVNPYFEKNLRRKFGDIRDIGGIPVMQCLCEPLIEEGRCRSLVHSTSRENRTSELRREGKNCLL